MRRLAVIVLALGAGASPACGKKADAPTPAPAAEPDAWIGACLDGFARAHDAPSWRRGRILVDACTPCGVPWHDALVMPVPAPGRVIAVVDACHPDCTKKARADLFAAVSAAENDLSPRTAWAAFAAACPAAMGSPGADGRYAGGAWFALDQIELHLAAARAHLPADRARQVDAALAMPIDLPLLSSVGTGFELPPGAALEPAVASYVTVTDKDVFVGATPRAHVTPTGLVADGDWPGRAITIDELTRLPHERHAIVAPTGLPAARALEVIRALAGAPSAIVVAADDKDALFGGEVGIPAHPAPQVASPAARYVVISAKGDRLGVLDKGGRFVATVAVSDPDHLPVSLAGDEAIVIDPGDATVGELIAFLPRLTRPTITLAQTFAWPAKLGTVDDVVKALAERTSP